MIARTIIAALFFVAAATSWGQTTTAPVAGGGPAPVTLTQTVEPSFRIEPVVLRFSARRGEIIPFEFTISSLGKQMDVTVEPVNLRQEETGLILHDGASKPSTALKISTPARFALNAGDQQKIAGELTVPLAKTNFLSFGILVREAGKAPDFKSAGKAATKAGIRFVTQYVLRVDVETGVADSGAMKQLRLERGMLVGSQGLPVARVYLTNPTEYAFECHVGATLASASGRKPTPVPLGMLSRASLDGPERFLLRIMPNSSLRLEAAMTSPLTIGEQVMHVGLAGDRREAVAAEFALRVGPEDFPGLAPQRAIVGGAVAVTPAQIELGSVRGAKRTLGLQFVNASSQTQQVEVEALTLGGEPLAGVRLTPAKFSIQPGGAKSVRAMLANAGDAPSECGVVHVRVGVAEGGAVDQQDLPLAVLREPRATPDLKISDVELAVIGGKNVFVVHVENRSGEFIPMRATLAVGGSGVQQSLDAGYGKWLRPGAEERLVFQPQDALPAGEYQLALTLATHDELPPLSREFVVTLSASDQTASGQAVKPSDAAG